MATSIGFELTIIDDREDYVTAARFPGAKRIVGDIERELKSYRIDAQTYVVLVTRGHRHDGAALAAVIDSKAKYIGMIGSKRKVRTVLDELEKSGVAREKLMRVQAPIGLGVFDRRVGPQPREHRAERVTRTHRPQFHGVHSSHDFTRFREHQPRATGRRVGPVFTGPRRLRAALPSGDARPFPAELDYQFLHARLRRRRCWRPAGGRNFAVGADRKRTGQRQGQQEQVVCTHCITFGTM